MINKRYAEAFVEVLDILKHMKPNDLEKVSNKFIDFLEENASKEYICNLDYTKNLIEMDLKQETIGLLAVMYEKFWCPEEDRQDLINIFYINEQKHQEELMEKYNPDKLFEKKEKDVIEPKENIPQVIEKKESILKRILNKIKLIFKIE